MSHLENFNHSEKEKNLIRVDQDRRHKNIDLVLHFQTHNTYNFYYVYYLSGILSDEKKSGLRFVCGRNNKNMMDAGVETDWRNINKPGWWHCRCWDKNVSEVFSSLWMWDSQRRIVSPLDDLHFVHMGLVTSPQICATCQNMTESWLDSQNHHHIM